MKTVQEILTELGYQLKNDKNGWRARPIYRESDNDTSLKIFSNGSFIDFSAQIKGNFEELIKLSMGLGDIDEVHEWLEKNEYTHLATSIRPKIKTQKVFNESNLDDLTKITTYWESRNISIETLNIFGGGVCYKGRMNGRYVFPIYADKKIVGFAGRDIYNNNEDRPKWKLLGQKSSWIYPIHINKNDIQEVKEVILVESIGDCLALYDYGIKNIIVLFGVEMSLSILNFLIRHDINKIIIALNNDIENGNIGQKAAEKLEKKLKKYFNPSQIIISLPTKKDFGEMSKTEINVWKLQTSQK